MKTFASLTRRNFLQKSGMLMLMAGVSARRMFAQAGLKSRPPMLNLSALPRFVDPLPLPPVISSSSTRPSPEDARQQIPYYKLTMQAVEVKLHRDMKPARMWGMAGTSPGPVIEARSGQGLFVEWANQLPTRHFLPIDHTIHGADAAKPEVRAVMHLHGAKTPPESDGYPEDWRVPGQSALYYYPNQQEAATLWYHDHALGITRLNVYAGLFGLFVIRDDFEDALNLPKGEYEVPVVLYDRLFDSDGQLFYPISGEARSPWVPEVFGNVILANGKLFPYLEVEPRKYRLRLLNAANGRFLHLAFSSGQQFHQIGTDLGLLPAPVPLTNLLLAPAERADLMVDFSAHAGQNIVLKNEMLSVMQFRVSSAKVKDPSSLPSVLRPLDRLTEHEAVKTRILTLGEKDDMAGLPKTMLLNNAHWEMPITENPKLGSLEIWELLNFTDDSHPVHLHLGRLQILDRRSFDPQAYYFGGRIRYTGAPMPPAPNEAGWKDTVQAPPGMITRILAKFDGYKGRYVWHCHILEHEDNEMMRPFEVT